MMNLTLKTLLWQFKLYLKKNWFDNIFLHKNCCFQYKTFPSHFHLKRLYCCLLAVQTKGSMGRSRQTLSSQAMARCSTSLLGFSNPPARFISDKKSADFLELPLSEGGHHLVSVWRSGLWSQVWLLDLFRLEGRDKLFRISQTLFLFGESRRNLFQSFLYKKLFPVGSGAAVRRGGRLEWFHAKWL